MFLKKHFCKLSWVSTTGGKQGDNIRNLVGKFCLTCDGGKWICYFLQLIVVALYISPPSI